METNFLSDYNIQHFQKQTEKPVTNVSYKSNRQIN